jgi:hypothetical protein
MNSKVFDKKFVKKHDGPGEIAEIKTLAKYEIVQV